MECKRYVKIPYFQQKSPLVKFEKNLARPKNENEILSYMVESTPREGNSDSLPFIKNLSMHFILTGYTQTTLLARAIIAKMLENACKSNVNDVDDYGKIDVFFNRNINVETILLKQQQFKNQKGNRIWLDNANCPSIHEQRPPFLHHQSHHQRKCYNLHQRETKQFLQFFMCFIVIIRIILWPEYCAAVQQHQHQHQDQQQQQQQQQPRQRQDRQKEAERHNEIVSVTLPTTIKTSSRTLKNVPNIPAQTPTTLKIETVQSPLDIALNATTTTIIKQPKRLTDNHNNSLSTHYIHTYLYAVALKLTPTITATTPTVITTTTTTTTTAAVITSSPLNSKTVHKVENKLVPVSVLTTISPALTSSFCAHREMLDRVSSVRNDTSTQLSTKFLMSKENLDFISSVSKHQQHHRHHQQQHDFDHYNYNYKKFSTAYRIRRSLDRMHNNSTSSNSNRNSSSSSALNDSTANGITSNVIGVNSGNMYSHTKPSYTANVIKMPNESANEGNGGKRIECPSFNENSACPCYNFEDGLFLECPGITALSLRATLERISSPIHSLSVYDYDRSITSLSHDVFQPGVNIKHLQFSHSHLETLKDNSLKNVRTSLESLSIVNSKLTQLPSRALHSMQKLNSLDFDYNDISTIENYSFYGLRLSKLNIKGNRLQNIPEHGFVGLEESIQEIDLSENDLRTFPLLALRKLDYLRILRLSNNKMSTFYGDIALTKNNATSAAILRLPSLIFLDLSSNQFTEITDDCFRAFSQLKTLSLYANQIEQIHPEAFKSLNELMSLDMSHNQIITLDGKIFQRNKRLQTVDLSHNHIHYINGVFSNLPQLREIFLSENNILELSADAFVNSSQVEVIYVESNAIAHVDPNVFSTLINLNHLYLRANFISLLPVTLLDKCQKLNSISLDSNEIQDLEIGMFRKLVYLREIRLHNNRIRRIRKGVFEPLLVLQELHLQKNSIEDIEPAAFKTLTNLQHINLQENQLTLLEDIFPGEYKNSSLLTIQLGTNYLSKIHPKTFITQNKVQIMWLNDNQLVLINKSSFVDLNNLSRLYLDNNLIEDIDLDTFKNLQQLQFLNMSHNRLKEIRRDYFAFLKNLEELNLAKNNIKSIERFAFSKLKSLRTLDLSHNPILQITNDVFLEELSLTHLYLQNTSLRKIEINAFKPLLNLNVLDLSGNFLNPSDIHKLDIAGLRSLTLSNINFTYMEGYDSTIPNMFDNLRSLQHLTMENCSLKSLPEQMFSKNTNLVKLNLCNNFISFLSRKVFQGLDVFKELKLCRNNLIEFPHMVLYNLSTLEILDLSQNHFTYIDFYKLSGTINLRQLNLKDNKIASLTGFNAVNLTQLDTLDISGNLLLSLPANFLHHSINLQKIDLSRNRLFQIPSSVLSDSSIPRLSWLNLTANPINKIYTVKEERYPHLKELYICQTNLSILTSKDFEAFQALQHLHLVNNRITRISPGAFKDLTNLLTLDISVNELEILPKERLQGLKLLRLLNISHNTLKDLEEFSTDLSQLQICDLSFNQLDRISRKTFRNLHALTDLYLTGNRMTVLSTEAFRYLKKLKVLDLRKNYFELIPIEALQPLETNIKTLRLEENPLHCSCDAQKLWEWLRDHRKWSSSSVMAGLTSAAVSTMSIPSPLYSLPSSSSSSTTSFTMSSLSTVTMTSGDNNNYLRCEHPAELRGKIFSKMEPQQFCDAPLIPKIAIQDIQPYSVIVSWQSREHLGLNGYEIIYHIIPDGAINSGNGNGGALPANNINGDSLVTDEIRGKRLNGSANSAKLTRLEPNTRYHICVIGTGNWLSESVNNTLQRIHFNDSFLLNHKDPDASSSLLTEYSHLTSSNLLRPVYQKFYSMELSSREQNVIIEEPQQQQSLVNRAISTKNALKDVLKNSRFSTCTDVQTLDSIPNLITDDNGLSSNSFIHSILTRRLGLIVGCCLGIIVFIIMISVLSYVKLKKQRIESAKRQAVMPPDYMSYRHFSIPNEELLRPSTIMSSVPSGISAHISGTSLSMSTGTNTATATSPLKITENLDKSFTTTSGGVTVTSDVKIGGCENLIVSTEMVTLNDNITDAETNHYQHILQHNQQQQYQQQQQQHQQQQQQHHQQYTHQKNGNAGGYVNAGIVLGTKHASNVAC